MRTALRVLVSPLWALALLAALAFTLLTLVATRLWEVVTPPATTTGQRDTPLIMVLLGQAITLALGVAVYVGVLQQSSVSSVEALVTPLVTGFVTALLAVTHVVFAHKSYKAELAAGVRQPIDVVPAGVGSGPPPGPALGPVAGPESVSGWENDTHIQQPRA